MCNCILCYLGRRNVFDRNDDCKKQDLVRGVKEYNLKSSFYNISEEERQEIVNKIEIIEEDTLAFEDLLRIMEDVLKLSDKENQTNE